MINAQVAKLLAGAALLLALIGWGTWEHIGRLKAESALELAQERLRETNRAVTALGTATDKAVERAAVLAQRRRVENQPLVDKLGQLELQLKEKNASGKDCRDALKEWRNAQ
jgi:hypothetical protein